MVPIANPDEPKRPVGVDGQTHHRSKNAETQGPRKEKLKVDTLDIFREVPEQRGGLEVGFT